VHPPVELGAEGQVGAPPMAMISQGLASGSWLA